ncbi:MAG: DMT family transporter [Planctomycetota bacterium]
MTYLGESAALATSVSWTLCGLGFAFASRRVGALAVNQIRILAAVVVLLAVHTVTYGAPWPAGLGSRQIGVLAISGVIGLGLGDLCYFHSMAVLGPRVGALLMGTSPVLCALMAWPALDEPLDAQSALGIGVVVCGVGIVLADPRGERGWAPAGTPQRRRAAIGAGLLAALCQAGGLILAKIGMSGGSTLGPPLEPLSATVVRMLAGAVAVAILAAARRHLRSTVQAGRDGRAMLATAVGVAFGPTLGVWLSMVSVKNAPAGVAATLMSLQPIMILPIARVAYGARPGPLAIVGAIFAVAGTAILFWPRGLSS